jgi:hypothetical protein
MSASIFRRTHVAEIPPGWAAFLLGAGGIGYGSERTGPEWAGADQRDRRRVPGRRKSGAGDPDSHVAVFLAANGAAVAAGATNVTLGTNGAWSVGLAPNAGATPASTYYTVVYQLQPSEVRT